MDDSFFTEKEKKKVNRGNVAPVVVVILVIIALGALLFFGGRYYLSSKNNIKILVDNYFNYLEENIVNTNSESGSLKFNVKGDTNGDNGKVFKILNNLDFTINYDIDYKNDIVNLDLNTNYYGDKLIDINTYIENNTLYFYSGDLYNKYIEYKIDKDGNGEKVTKEDIKTLVNGIKNAISESLKDEYFTKSNEKVDGKMLNKVELNLNKSNTKSIYEDIINEVGIAKGTLYYYFKSKEDIMDGIIEKTSEKLLAAYTNLLSPNFDPTKNSQTVKHLLKNHDNKLK